MTPCSKDWGHQWLYVGTDVWAIKSWVCTKCAKEDWS